MGRYQSKANKYEWLFWNTNENKEETKEYGSPENKLSHIVRLLPCLASCLPNIGIYNSQTIEQS